MNSASSTLTIANSTISATRDGIKVTNSAKANIQGSTFTGNRRGIFVDAPADEANIFIGNVIGNNFYANNAFATSTASFLAGIQYSDTDTLTATGNWWGDVLGPLTANPNPVIAPRDAAYGTTGGTINFTPFAGSIFTILPSNL